MKLSLFTFLSNSFLRSKVRNLEELYEMDFDMLNLYAGSIGAILGSAVLVWYGLHWACLSILV